MKLRDINTYIAEANDRPATTSPKQLAMASSFKPIGILILVLSAFSTACQAVAVPGSNFDPHALQFSGERAFAIESEYVDRFPDRQSGKPNNHLAAQNFVENLSKSGWECQEDEWEVTSYSQPLTLVNGVCRLEGQSDGEILVVAHHDIAPTTSQGADNDASGVAILTHLAEIFSAEGQPNYTLVFASTDGEELGMAGTGRLMWTYPDKDKIIAAFSLDNLGRYYYDAMNIEMIGQYGGYSPIWLPLAVRQAARAAGLWEVILTVPLEQVTNQAVPISLMDQGPMVAAGVPALGFAGHKPPEFLEWHLRTLWHGPEDSLKNQSAEALGQSGLVVEASLRQLLAMQEFPEQTGPYLYFDRSQSMLRGLPLWLIFGSFTSLFFVGSFISGGRSWQAVKRGWRKALPHFFSLWLPLLGTVLLLYLLVAAGLMYEYYGFPGITKDPVSMQVSWVAVGIALAGLALFLFSGRWLAVRLAGDQDPAGFAEVKSLSCLVIGLAGVYLLLRNPFSLLFLVPVLFWMLIGGRHGFGKALDLLCFILGGLLVYLLIYQFGFTILYYNWTFLWYMLNMFSSQMISPVSAVMITAVVGAGLALLVTPPGKKPTQS